MIAYINLTAINSASQAISIKPGSTINVTILGTFGNAEVEIEYSHNYNDDNTSISDTWSSLSPPVKIGSNETATNIRVPAQWVRAKVTTADGAAEAGAEVYLWVVNQEVNPPSDLKILGQAVSATSASTLYSPGNGVRAEVSGIVCANVSGATANFYLYMDTDGSTADSTTAIYWNKEVEKDQTFPIEPDIPWVLDSSGTISVKSATASDFTVTVWGRE